MRLEVTFKGATEPQLKRTLTDADLMLSNIALIKLLDNNGLLYAPIEKIQITMDEIEFINIA